MTGETNLDTLLKIMKPKLNMGAFVFCTVKNLTLVNLNESVLFFKEKEGYTVIVKKELADTLNLDYTFISSWITLTVHSSLEADGLTAAFSKALAENGIGCNVVLFYEFLLLTTLILWNLSVKLVQL